MERKDILEKLTEIARDVFDDSELVFTEETTAADVDDWDSLSHISFISDIEEEFKIKFTLDEVMGTQNVGEFINAVLKHLNAK